MSRSLPSHRLRTLGLLLVAALMACDGDDGTGPTVGPPAKLAFTVQPADAGHSTPISPAVQVAVQDASGNTVTTTSNAVTLAIGTNPTGGRLSGTTTTNAVGGVASFADVEIDRSGTDYTFVASSGTLTSASSVAFDIVFSFQSLGAGNSTYTCGVATSGEAYCWGGGKGGRLGNGTTTSSTIPVAVSGGLFFQSISAGFDHTCGVTTDGKAYCWGASGRLGDGTNNSSTTPVAVAGGLSFKSVANGVFHSCALTTGGEAYCWGVSNSDGQLGDGTTNNSMVPVAVAGGLSFKSLSAGGSTSCGLTTGGEAYCWGNNTGNGTTTSSAVPVPVTGGLTFQSVSTGGGHSCGVTTGGEAYCWGNNVFGQVGDGTGNNSMVPVSVAGGLSFQSLSAGAEHTCGVTTRGPAYCWGKGGSGQLGNGSTAIQATPVRVSDPQ